MYNMELYLSFSINERINYRANFSDTNKLSIAINELNTFGDRLLFGSHLMPPHKAMDCNGYYC